MGSYSTKLILVLGTRYFIFNTLCSSKKHLKRTFVVYFAIFCTKKTLSLHVFLRDSALLMILMISILEIPSVCGKTWGKFLREKANASQSPPYTISGLTTTTDRKAASSILNANAVLVECHNTPT